MFSLKAQQESQATLHGSVEVRCFPILMMLINIPLPTSVRKPSHQNQVQYLLSTSRVPTWQNPSTVTCFTLESLFKLSLSFLPQC